MSKTKEDALVCFKDVYLKRNNKEILSNINLKIEKGKIVTIIGPNGAGKSTLLKLIIGQISSTAGEIYKQKRLNLGYVPQKVTINAILPITVEKFVNYSLNIIHYLGLENIRKNFLYSLSGGELQKVLLARALIRSPELLLLDETSQGLDISGILKFYDIIDEINKQKNTAIVMVSHDLNIVLNRTDEVVCLDKKICCKGLPQHLTSKEEFVNLFGKDTANNISLYKHNHKLDIKIKEGF